MDEIYFITLSALDEGESQKTADEYVASQHGAWYRNQIDNL